jgi:hypothetical protein
MTHTHDMLLKYKTHAQMTLPCSQLQEPWLLRQVDGNAVYNFFKNIFYLKIYQNNFLFLKLLYKYHRKILK